MPKIPTYQRQQTIPGQAAAVPASIAQAGQVGRAISGIGRGLEVVSDVVAERQEQLRQRDNVNRAQLVMSSYRAEERAFESDETARTGQDSYDNLTRGEQFRQASVEKHTAGVEDVELRQYISTTIGNRGEGLLDRLDRHQELQRETVTTQAIEFNTMELLKDAYDGHPFSETIATFREVISAQNLAGGLGDEEAADMLMRGENSLAEAHLDGMISRDPQGAIDAIKAGEYSEYMDQGKIEEYDKKAKALQKAIAADLKTKKKEADKAARDQLAVEREATGNEFTDKILTGDLSYVDDVLSSNLEPTGENSKDYWRKRLEDRDEKLEKEKWETDPQVRADFLTEIVLDPEAVSDTRIVEAQGRGLNTDKAKEMVNLKRSLTGDKVDPATTMESKTAFQRLKDARTDDFFDTEDEIENSRMWSEDAILLHRFIQNHPEENPNDFVDTIMKAREAAMVHGWFDIWGKGSPEERERMEQERLELEAGPRLKEQASQTSQTRKTLPNGKTYYVLDGEWVEEVEE